MAGPFQLEFVTSAQRVEDLPASDAEITFVGRSNVGKSSLINALANRKRLAHVSNTPGRTRLLNLFSITADGTKAARAKDRSGRRHSGALPATMVDLPGYGFAKAPAGMRAQWQSMIEGYLRGREQLRMVIVLVDGVVGATDLDLGMLEWLQAEGLPHTVVVTKFDKVKASARERQLGRIAEDCRLERGDIIWVSAEKAQGLDKLRSLIRSWIA